MTILCSVVLDGLGGAGDKIKPSSEGFLFNFCAEAWIPFLVMGVGS